MGLLPVGPDRRRLVPGDYPCGTSHPVPPIAVLLGWLFLGVVPPPLAVPGGILCLAGVGLARWRPGRRSRRMPAPALAATEGTLLGAGPGQLAMPPDDQLAELDG